MSGVINYVCGLEIFDRHNLHLIVFATGILLDPLFYYIHAISNDQICDLFDGNMALWVCAPRTVFDFINIFFCFFVKRRNDAGKRMFWISLCSSLPLPQVILIPILIRFQIPNVSMMLLSRIAIGVVGAQSMMKMPLLLELARRCTIPLLSFSRWAAKFIYLYLAFSQLLGALWYHAAIDKGVNCWKKKCGSGIDNACDDPAICNLKNSGFNQNFDLHRVCSRNSTDFGLFHDLYQSEILQMTGSGLPWALQNLSSFGQNLETGSNVGENIFIILVIMATVMLFIFVVGQMQDYVQSDVASFEGRKKKKQETEQWSPFNRLSENLQSQLMNYKQDLWRDTKPANIEDMFYYLPNYLKRGMINEICFHHLKQLREFEGWSEESLADLCDYLKPVFYKEHTRIIRERDPIDKMILVVQGKVWNYSSSYLGNINDRGIYELVDWFNYNPRASHLPISLMTSQAATDVEAFILMAYDLQNISIKRNNQTMGSRQPNKRSKRALHKRK